MIGDAIAQAMIAGMIVVALISVGATLLLVYGLPWLWTLVKPWLHMVTG